MSSLSPEEQERLVYNWDFWARPQQKAPPGDWDVWMIMSGRGFGKTRSGAEWVKERQAQGAGHISLIADDAKDARDVMIEGESGLLSLYPKLARPRYVASQAKIEWPNGATAILYSAHDPESLRGPQSDTVWADELAKWKKQYQSKAWDNAIMGMRLPFTDRQGKLHAPRAVVTTTPTPTDVVIQLVQFAKDKAPDQLRVTITSGSTYENIQNLSAVFQRQVRQYEGTRLGRQELYAELLMDVPGALWNVMMIEEARVGVRDVPQLERVVVAVDPAITANEETSNETGIVVAGKARHPITKEEHGYVLADYSGIYSPLEWAMETKNAYELWGADRVIGEANQGGEMVRSNIHTVGPRIPVTLIHVTRGKYLRAEPVAALYERGLVHHVGILPKLEDQMCSWQPGEDSPDRLDAKVHALTELLIGPSPSGKLVTAR